MQKQCFLGVLLLILVLTMACGLPIGYSPARQTETASSLIFSAEKTIAAQQLGETATNLAGGFSGTSTANALFIMATQTALSLQETLQSYAANATEASQLALATAQALSATTAANVLQATESSRALTATAQAFQPPLQYVPSAMTRLSFEPGATSTHWDGQISKDQTIDFSIRALGGQTMMVNVYSSNDNVFLGITGLSDGKPLIRTTDARTSYYGTLPATQDYAIKLFSPQQTSDCTLQIIIPVRVQFAPGGTSKSLNGFLTGGNVNYYLAWAKAGQQMSITIISPHNDVFLTIYGMEDGSPLIRYLAEMTSWTGVLPRTQDYMIEAVSTGSNSDYTMQVIIQ